MYPSTSTDSPSLSAQLPYSQPCSPAKLVALLWLACPGTAPRVWDQIQDGHIFRCFAFVSEPQIWVYPCKSDIKRLESSTHPAPEPANAHAWAMPLVVQKVQERTFAPRSFTIGRMEIHIDPHQSPPNLDIYVYLYSQTLFSSFEAVQRRWVTYVGTGTLGESFLTSRIN